MPGEAVETEGYRKASWKSEHKLGLQDWDRQRGMLVLRGIIAQG